LQLAGHISTLRFDGSVWCTGANDHGQLGQGMNDKKTWPFGVRDLHRLP
jgi:alpha-tubulin suppressor-like RCC1 family protein